MMNLGELIETFRDRADDFAEPPLWSNEELIRHANEAVMEACRRSRLIKDSVTAEVCEIDIVAGQSVYPLDKRIIRVLRVKVDGNTIPLPTERFETMDRFMPGWEDHEGTVECWVSGMDTRMLRLYRKPAQNGKIRLTVVREPLVKMEKPGDVPEIEERYHLPLVYWMLFRAYSKKDQEAYDKELYRINLDAFEREFGTQQAANAWDEEFMLNQPKYFHDGRF